MSEEKFQQIIAKDKNLKLLINERSINGLASFKKTDEMTPEFVDWVSPKYYDSFEAIYVKSIDQKQGAICALLRASFLANDATKHKIGLLTVPFLEQLVDNASIFLAEVKESPKKAVMQTARMNDNFNHLAKLIFKHLKTPEVEQRKKELITIYTEVCGLLKDFGPRKYPVEYEVYKAFVDQTAILHGNDVKGASTLTSHKSNIDKKNTGYIIGVVVLVLFFILRMVLRLNR